MSKRVIEVMIVESLRLMREGLTQLLKLETNINVITQAENGEEAIKKALKYKPDIILLDMNMPGMNGIEVLRSFKDLRVRSKVIMFTIDEKRGSLFEAMKIGAKGYILKDTDSNSLKKAIVDVSQGKVYVQSNLSPLFAKENYSKKKDMDKDLLKIDLLSNREYEVLLLIAEGLSNKDIGKNLYISEKTVKNHVSNIFKKIEVEDRVKATIFVYRTKIKEI